MGKTRSKRIVYTLSILILIAGPTIAQEIDDAGVIIRVGTDDASLLMREYLSPFAKGFGTGVNTGWFNSASNHEKFGFDITVNASTVFVPGSDQEFDVRELEFSRLQWDRTSTPITPTLSGDDEVSTSRLIIRENGVTIDDIIMPEGSGYNFVPVPMIQASLGLPVNTQVTLRYSPQIDIDTYGSIKLFGLGVKHGINQWLPGGNLLPFKLAVQAGFTNLDVDGVLEVEPEETADNNPYPPNEWDNQEIVTSTKAFTANAIISKDLSLITFFGGVGIESATMEITAKGQYPIEVLNDDTPDPSDTTIESIAGEDIIDFTIDSENSIHALAGLRFKVLIFEIAGSYTFAQYSMAQASIGFSFR